MQLPSEYRDRGNHLLIDLEGPAAEALDTLSLMHKHKLASPPEFAANCAKWMEYVHSLPEDDQIAIMIAAVRLAPPMIIYDEVHDWIVQHSPHLSRIYKAI